MTIARRQRGSDEWYLGSVSDEFARSFDLPLSFLEAGKSYVAEIYADAHNADWHDKSNEIAISEQTVTSETVFPVRLAPGGGLAVRFRPAQ